MPILAWIADMLPLGRNVEETEDRGNGAGRIRTGDLRLARAAFSQLNYSPNSRWFGFLLPFG